MPTYKNNTTRTIGVASGPKAMIFAPGEEKELTWYIDNSDITLTSHLPQVLPFEVLYNGAVPSGILTDGLPGWESLVVYNGTDATVQVCPNGQDIAYIDIAAGSSWAIKGLDSKWGAVEIKGSGVGIVQVIAI